MNVNVDLSEWSTSSLFVCLWMVSRHGGGPPAWIHNCLIEGHSDWEPGTSVTDRPHTDKHAALEKNLKNLMRRYSCWLRLRRDWNASHCSESHLTTMGRSRTVCSTMPPRCSVQKASLPLAAAAPCWARWTAWETGRLCSSSIKDVFQQLLWWHSCYDGTTEAPPKQTFLLDLCWEFGKFNLLQGICTRCL